VWGGYGDRGGGCKEGDEGGGGGGGGGGVKKGEKGGEGASKEGRGERRLARTSGRRGG